MKSFVRAAGLLALASLGCTSDTTVLSSEAQGGSSGTSGAAGTSAGGHAGTAGHAGSATKPVCDPTAEARQTDRLNCGTCGHQCSSGQKCVAGACALACDGGRTACNGFCTDTSTDRDHCGGCGHACGASEVCAESACQACPAGQSACGSACLDLTTDRDHCGKCDEACGSTQICLDGGCQGCLAGQKMCHNACLDVGVDHANCGSCGHACGQTEVCSEGTCQSTCTGVTSLCNGQCLDLQTSTLGCGQCGHPCGPSQTCSKGECQGSASVTLSQAVSYPSSKPADCFSVGDLDGDGDLDLVVGAYADSVTVWRNEGTGAFVSAGSFPANVGIETVLIDLNGDGHLDLFLDGKFGAVFPGKGDGSFGPALGFTQEANASLSTVADVTGDSRPDVLSVTDDGTLAMRRGKGDGTFEPSVATPLGRRASMLLASDLDGDGRLDLVVGSSPSEVNQPHSVISLMLGKGDGSFSAPADIISFDEAGFLPVSLVMDANGDGHLDLVVGDTSKHVLVVPGKGDGSFGPPISSSSLYAPWNLTQGDLNGDGKPDLLVYSVPKSGFVPLFGQGNGSFAIGALITPSFPNYQLADLNTDGGADLVYVDNFADAKPLKIRLNTTLP